MLLNIATTNKYKLANARKNLSPLKIRIKAIKIETPEIQSLNGKDIATFSSRFAADKLGQPVAVTDASMYVKALGGFPGPFVKFTNHWLTVEDFKHLMENHRERSVTLIEWLAFCEPGKQPKAFKSTIHGKMSASPQGLSPNPIDSFFVPEGYAKPLATWTERDKRRLFAEKLTHWKKLAELLRNHN